MPGIAPLGQWLINDLLPPELRDHQRVLDKSGLSKLLREVAEKHPDKYREISQKLLRIGGEASYMSGGNSFGLHHLQSAVAAKRRAELSPQIQAVMDDDDISDEERESRIQKLLSAAQQSWPKEIYQEARDQNNPLGLQVLSGSRGNQTNLNTLVGGDLQYVDQHDRPVPVPVLRSYSQGLTPLEYWAGTYGTRKGVVATKMATAEAGFFGKQLAQIVHRAVVTALDDDKEPTTLRGFPTDISDPDNEGALLAAPMGGFPRNTILTPKIIRQIERSGAKRLLVRSPLVGGPADGGVYARDVGVRERGGLPGRGDNVGMAAVQSISEPLSQGQLNSKHVGGVASQGRAASGFDYINQLVAAPRTFQGGAVHSEHDGTIESIAPAPAGGQHVMIAGKAHYVPPGAELKFKRGDTIEAGDLLTDGYPNPNMLVPHKGLGEGRRIFVNAMLEALSNAGIKAHRHNIELLGSKLINHVRLTDEAADGVPGDVVPYHSIEHRYEPRLGMLSITPKRALGKYLERPYLHYAIGTKIRPSMLKDFDEFGVSSVDVHDEPPPFEPVMIRGMANLHHDPDWMTQMFGSGLKGSLLESARHGAYSDPTGTSFVPSLAEGVHFGQRGKVRPPEPPIKQPPGLLG